MSHHFQLWASLSACEMNLCSMWNTDFRQLNIMAKKSVELLVYYILHKAN